MRLLPRPDELSRIVSLALVALAGCGGESLDRYPLTGTVTYDGKPVESGVIFFEPKASAGKLAPTVYLSIEDGKLDAENEGPVKGTYHVIVRGYDKSKERVDDDGITITPQLFPDYEFDVEIPPPDNVLNVEVPKGGTAAAGN
jgi:hypothetical protein